MENTLQNRRGILSSGLIAPAILAAGAALSACSDEGGEKEVGAVEDLMREHGILRRAILVFRESATALQGGRAVDPAPLAEAARLFRKFGEDYHERKLEEAYIFPAIRKAGGPAAAVIDTLLAQHNRGRQITSYILSVTAKGIGSGDVAPLSSAFNSFELMYANHTAREDTIVFPAWKRALSDREIDEMGDKFEDIEKQEFGGDGFDYAVRKIGQIEQALGLNDLAKFTAPAPSQS
jgi:hemerythrin-like domain-containing protein